MADPKVLELSVQTFTTDKLEIKVKNISGAALERPLSIEFYAPAFLVNSKINDAAKAAASNTKPIGVASLAGVVSGPESWSVWARPESSDTSVVILLLNDLDQGGTDLAIPIKVAAGAEFTIGIPLNPQANRAALSLVYSYQYGNDPADKRVDGKLELKSSDTTEWTPEVTLITTHGSPTAIPAGDPAKIFWHIKDGVSATLRGPLPGGNNELPLSEKPEADFKMSDGMLEVRVVSAMTYVLQAEVKRPGHPNVQVVRMLSLDTRNKQFTYLSPRPRRVLPFGLIEIDWAAWGVKKVMLSVSGHTTRTINLTQQTLGRFYEGSGIMRVTATKEVNDVPTIAERVTIDAPPESSKTKNVEVIPWIPMTKPDLEGEPMGMAVITPKIGVLTHLGFYIAEVGEVDPTPPLKKLAFSLKPVPPFEGMWHALTAVGQRFVCMRRIMKGMPDLDLMAFTADGNVDEIPPVTLPPEIRPAAFSQDAIIDFVGFGGRAYVVAEASRSLGNIRSAWSVGFNSQTKKADVRPEPLLEPLMGYRLVTFDDGLYALNRTSGRMFRFDRTKTGTLEPVRKAATALKKYEGPGAKEESMVKDGLLVPVGRMLVVMSPTSVPSLASLEKFGQRNTLRYTSTSAGSDKFPQDLLYNPQRDYWGRCGHDLDVKSNWLAAFRDSDSARLWVLKPNLEVQSLAVGDETLFAPDYVFEFPSKPLPPYLNKKRQFKITSMTGMRLQALSETYRKAGLSDFSTSGPTELASPLPNLLLNGVPETVEFKYNEADPVPVTVRFQVSNNTGAKHDYVLELTFSGPDLATATSVFKRIVMTGRDMFSMADVPGTTVQHSTSGPIVIPPPKPLVEGVKLRLHNNTTYQIWQESPEAKDRNEVENRYFGDEISIKYDTPAFYLMAYGAGELHINVDLALPVGIEISSGSTPQLKAVRINPDKSNGLYAELLPNKDETSFECRINYRLMKQVEGVYMGDGVATERGEAIYLPLASLFMQVDCRVLRINPENLSTIVNTPSGAMQSTGVFSTPNSIALSNEFVFAIFGDTNIHVLDYALQIQDKVSVGDVYSVVTAIKCPYTSEYFFVGIKHDRTNVQNINVHFNLAGKSIAKSSGPRKVTTSNTREVSLDSVKGFREQNRMTGYPTWISSKTVSPMALSTSIVSPGGERVREVAVAIEGGLFVVGSSDKTIRVLGLESAGREEEIVFGREGKSIYCLHSQGDNQGLRVSRVDNKTWKQTHGLSLPPGEGVADLTTDTRQRQAGTAYKNHRSISMVISLDEKWLFVSHGKSIFKIDVAKMELRETYKTELPCRVFHVWFGKPTETSHVTYGTPSSCTLLYAIGSSYKGNGIDGRESQTHIYKFGIPDK